jgi:hypothetical protein
MEIWKTVAGYEGLYEVSSTGKVRSLFRYKKELKPKTNKAGYKRVNLFKNKIGKWYSVLRLVAEAFCEQPEGCTIVNHIDENPSNNKSTNLEWMTHAKNVVYGNFTPRRMVTLHKIGRVRNVIQKDIEGKIIARYGSVKEASEKSGVPYTTIANVLKRGVRWRKDFLWEYAE